MSGWTAISVRLDEKMKKALEKQAKQQDRSTSYIARKAIEDHIRYSELEKEAIEEAIKEADKWEFISWEAMRAWVESWGEENELPEPKVDIFEKN